MLRWVTHLEPHADEAQLLAARAHHLRRWAVPRSAYPEGRAGYLRWRTEQKRRHAEEASEILVAAGYEQDTVDRVAAIVVKRGLGPHGASDPAVQVHEDALCLTFLSTQLEGLAAELGDDQTVEVLRKTIAKMTDRAVAVAGELPLSDRGRALLARASAGRPLPCANGRTD